MRRSKTVRGNCWSKGAAKILLRACAGRALAIEPRARASAKRERAQCFRPIENRTLAAEENKYQGVSVEELKKE